MPNVVKIACLELPMAFQTSNNTTIMDICDGLFCPKYACISASHESRHLLFTDCYVQSCTKGIQTTCQTNRSDSIASISNVQT